MKRLRYRAGVGMRHCIVSGSLELFAQDFSGMDSYFARIRLFFALCSSSHKPSASISGGM